jgi:hypothetical protein
MSGVTLTKETAVRMGEATIVVEDMVNEVLPSRDTPRRKSNAGGGDSSKIAVITSKVTTWKYKASIYDGYDSNLEPTGTPTTGIDVYIPKNTLASGETIDNDTELLVILKDFAGTQVYTPLHHIGMI